MVGGEFTTLVNPLAINRKSEYTLTFRICSRKITARVHKQISTRMFIVAMLIIANNNRQAKCPLTGNS